VTFLIYRARNRRTGQVYVGYTSRTLARRRSSHKYEAFSRTGGDQRSGAARRDRPFYAALRKFGWEAFDWSVLCETHHMQDAKQAEEAFILYYADNYNLTDGFGGCKSNLQKGRKHERG
jgi:hypothetical protein